jgi:hypothetical protein
LPGAGTVHHIKTGYGPSRTNVRVAANPDVGFRICEDAP